MSDNGNGITVRIEKSSENKMRNEYKIPTNKDQERNSALELVVRELSEKLSAIKSFYGENIFKSNSGTALQSLMKSIAVDEKMNKTWEKNRENFMSRMREAFNEKKIFLIGVSYVNQLNSTYINHFISESGQNQFHVYKITDGAARPSIRISDIDEIISYSPISIFYGIGFSDIGFKPYPIGWRPQCLESFEELINQDSKSELKIPRIQDFAKYFHIQDLLPKQIRLH